MPLSLNAHNEMLDFLGDNVDEVRLITTTTLQTDVPAGASTCTLNRAVSAGDEISLNSGTARETFVVLADAAIGADVQLGNFAGDEKLTGESFGANTAVGHAPKVGADVVEPSAGAYGPQTINWNGASGSNLDSASPAPTFDVDGGNEVGAFALYNATSGTFYGSFLTTNIEGFGAAGSYQLDDADVSLASNAPQ